MSGVHIIGNSQLYSIHHQTPPSLLPFILWRWSKQNNCHIQSGFVILGCTYFFNYTDELHVCLDVVISVKSKLVYCGMVTHYSQLYSMIFLATCVRNWVSTDKGKLKQVNLPAHIRHFRSHKDVLYNVYKYLLCLAPIAHNYVCKCLPCVEYWVG